MIFNNGNYNPMDRQYEFIEEISINAPSDRDGKKPVVGIKDMGQSIIDGQGAGTFNQSVVAAIRAGAGRLERASPLVVGNRREPGADQFGPFGHQPDCRQHHICRRQAD